MVLVLAAAAAFGIAALGGSQRDAPGGASSIVPPTASSPLAAASSTAAPAGSVSSAPSVVPAVRAGASGGVERSGGPTSWPAKAGGGSVPRCVGPFPVDVKVVGATDQVRREKVPLPGGRVATRLTWRTAAGRLDVQWPPSPRGLYAHGTQTVTEPTVDLVEGAADGRTIDARGMEKTAVGEPRWPRAVHYTLTLKRGIASMPAWPCDKVQVRLTTREGAAETVGYRVDRSAASFDLGPLIRRVVAVPGPVPVGQSILCADGNSSMDQATPTLEYSSRMFATAAKALRAFLVSADAAQLDIASGRRPYTEYRVRSDGSRRFEHYTNWNEHVAVVALRTDAGWSLTGYTSTC